MKTALLSVDDDRLVLTALRLQLNRYYSDTHYLEFAQGAEEGFEIVEELRLRGVKTVLVISDWIMPGMNGDVFLTKLRKRYPDITCMMLTGQASGAETETFIGSGIASKVLEKPWTEKALIDTINELI